MPDQREQPVAGDGGGCCGPRGCCGPVSVAGIGVDASLMARREFLRIGALAAMAGSVAGWPRGAIAGPFEFGEDGFPIPADKKFDAAWIASLTARGEPTVYRRSAGELEFIGMPIGGICCGQVYLAGDGRLCHWDVFNLPQAPMWSDTAGPMYAKPWRPTSPIAQGFAIRVVEGGAVQAWRLDATGFSEIEFRGEYPVGRVRYADEKCPVTVELEAMSPFCPLDEATSGTPAIVMHYTVRNRSARRVEVAVNGWLENAVCRESGRGRAGKRVSAVVGEACRGVAGAAVEFSARSARGDEAPARADRPEIVFEDWERGTYEGWTVTGTAFGEKPRNLADIAGYQGNLNAQGRWTVNTHETRHGEDVVAADVHIGTLTSRAFVIERNFIGFRIGGGNHPGQTCVNLLVDGAVVRTATGTDNNRMRLENFDVRELAEKEGRIQIVDGWKGAWGNIGCDEIVFCDSPRQEAFEMARAADFGSMSLSVLGTGAEGRVGMEAGEAAGWFGGEGAGGGGVVEAEFGAARAVGCVASGAMALEPGEAKTVTFVVAWHFANPDRGQLSFLNDSERLRRWYAGRYADAAAVRNAVIGEIEKLSGVTRLWRDTWNDSSLPHWFLDRTFATVSTAATATCWRFDNGRFYGWEGTYCCAGTCTHVWHYAQGLARVFPNLERSTREMVDFGLAFNEQSGQIDYRAEAARELAVDGQCGTILRAYREHQMCAGEGFLRGVWPRVKKAMELMLKRDEQGDGILRTAQYNTLDTTWYGEIAWITSMYLAAAGAAGAMAAEMGDAAFAERCAAVVRKGGEGMVKRLFNGEYFVHLPDAAHPETNSTGPGCHIDQLLGQSWAHQVGLGRIVPLEQSKKALASMYRYSFAPDIGPYRAFAEKTVKGGRWYAMPGEGGLLMCTWPKGGSEAASGKGGDAWAAGYFNECMSGFEHQVASHMIWEGLTVEGMAITRMIHDRYHAKKRNPWNEIECSNHYARAMAAYGSFVAACGFTHHGPKGRIGFGPRINADAFKAAFIGAGGWGQFRQARDARGMVAEIEVRWGAVSLREIALEPRAAGKRVVVRLGGAVMVSTVRNEAGRAVVALAELVTVKAGETLRVELPA